METSGLYVHIPFCLQKCAYCDFCSYAGLEALHDNYVRALETELARCQEDWRAITFDTLYFGGGTPTVLAPSALLHILEQSCRMLRIADSAEVSLEANPGTVNLESLLALRRGGFNRLSLGVQSLRDEELTLLGRIHTASEALAAIALARRAGYDNLSLDLMYGLPNQTLAAWRETLSRAIEAQPQHLSLYCLTLEEGTPLASAVRAGQIPRPDEGLAADMYAVAECALTQAGLAQYEISNWAWGIAYRNDEGLPAFACRHNLKYWRNQTYLGIGAAAHSYDGAQRRANVPSVTEYIARIGSERSPVESCELTTDDLRLGETMMLGLRLVQGVCARDFEARFGARLEVVYGGIIDELMTDGLLERDVHGVRLTPRGRLLGNRVFAAFLR